MDEKVTNLPPDPVDPATIAKHLGALRVADAVDALDALDHPTAVAVLKAMPSALAVQLFDEAGLVHPHKIVELLPDALAGAILHGISADRRVEIFRKLKAPDRQRLSKLLSPEDQTALAQLLTYQDHTAGGMMTTEFLSLPPDLRVGEALRHIREVANEKETIYSIYIVDPATRRLIQPISLRDLILAEPSATIGSIERHREPIVVLPNTDREEVSALISKYDLLAIPVVEASGKIVGIVTVDDVIDVMVEEATEDAQRFGGMESLDAPYMEISFLGMIKKRAGWLCALFLSEMLTASAMQHYEAELERAVVLTLFIPLIMSSGGNSGSQATSLIIRALALGEVKLKDWWRIASRELPSGIVLGSILGVIGFARITIWQMAGLYDYGEHWTLIAATVGCALVGIVTFGSLAGSMLPFLLKRLGFDPATASAPFVATLVDVTGLIIYFSIAYQILRGTLL
ncbi:magnesium transporter [uncultured Rhodoblastus sp.]|uniref:magnesium transporter n=1 Tax=uncultured Rhodoblastus sp. TaxID=543037 RepID=UPI0025EA0B5B|nr:magnesium transporter [uncultured Rhodoblastus sp.]